MNFIEKSGRLPDVSGKGRKMENIRPVMDFEFDTRKIQNTHFHQNPEIIYVLEGGLEIEIETDTQELEKGEFLLVNANKRHSIRETKKELLLVSIQMDFSTLVEYLGTNQILFWCNSAADKSDAYEQLKKALDRMLNRYYDKEKEGALFLNSIYYEVLYLLTSYFMIKADDNRLKEQMSPDNSRVFEIQNYVQANYQKQISLNDLAKKLYLSNAYLSKYIKKRFGLSFLEYVNNIRLFHAVDELLYTDKKITRIALDNGFPTSASFNKAFREIYHMTPSIYRANIRQEEKEDTDTAPRQEEIGQRVKDYLAGNVPVEDTVAARNMSLFTVDAADTKEYSKNWCKIINIGKVEALLDSNMQQQVLLMKEELGFSYVRIWNIFVEDMYDEDEEKGWHYNFSRMDRGLDFLVDHKLKPYIELSFKPIHVSYTINSSLAQKENEILFHERESYEKVMHDLASHLINRYGLEEIETWYFELWKDDRMNMQDENGWYFDCFEIGYEALKTISPKIKVGGAGFAMGYDRFQYRNLISNWKKRAIRPDFISVYSYSYELIQQNNLYFGKRSLDHNFVKNQVDIFKKILEEEDFVQPELHITEWNFTISNRNCINDSCAHGAYVMKTCIESIGNVDMMGYWHGSDLHTEFYDTEGVLYGDNGLLTRDGIKKPSFYAFHFLHFAQPRMLGKTENSLLTTNGRGTYSIVCHNCKQFNYRYAMKEEKDIRIEEIDELYEDLDAVHLKFEIRNVKDGDYLMRVFYVNKDNGSVQNTWRDMEYIKNLSKGEIDYMRRSAMPKVELRKLKVEGGVLRVETKLLAHEIKALDIRYQY